MVKIRLSRTGRRNLASYKIIVTPAREKRESKYIEQLGHYNPHTKDLIINKERAAHWLSVGAQPTETVSAFFIKEGILEKPKAKRVFKKQPGKKSVERSEKKVQKATVKEEVKVEEEKTEATE